jgi:hypothetical protein
LSTNNETMIIMVFCSSNVQYFVYFRFFRGNLYSFDMIPNLRKRDYFHIRLFFLFLGEVFIRTVDPPLFASFT